MPTSAGEGGGLKEGELFAGYTIVRRLGAGGMGQVYLAQHPRLPRRDALKVLPREFTANSEFRQRFNREAELAGSLYNQHIVGIHDRGEYDGQLWLSMDYVEGTDAAELLRTQYPSGMPLPEVVEIVSAVADALDYAHSRGLLHRDVKPANILLGHGQPKRRILLADFGIARQLGQTSNLTATNMTMGTSAYCAPEQLQGFDLDGRADQYALACTAFQLLTGGAPFQDSNVALLITQHLSAPPPLLSTRRPELRHLDGVIVRALAKDPAGRFASCAEFATALGAPPGTVHLPVPPPGAMVPTQVMPPPPPMQRGGHGTLIAALIAVALVVAAAVLGLVALQGRSGQPAAAPSREPSTGNSSRAAAPPPGSNAAPPTLRLTDSVTDDARVLRPAERAVVERDIKKLYDGRHIKLWVVYVQDFGEFKPAKWAERTMYANDFTDIDALLAISTDRPSFSFHVPVAVTVGKPIDVEEIRRERVAPAVERREWTRAALAAANGLDVAPN
ncbi:serine/threonine-protein kinase [Mycobacterium asiaticum]|uniref:non-specific serine/threonine protein kinase n=1 Tax=Mycobacterium asiaticum TaxID=1790 RepID=A0A1A3MWL3_MYCAS|nr:serine/threonine-protein kinase [Mycobacterium asiaticum]OBK12552.1 serine/threonine protein kinase [Mycobacterium asiaticum]